MKILFKRLTSRPLESFRQVRRRHGLKLRQVMLELKAALAQEKAETREMLRLYNLYIQGQAQPGDMKMANRQLMDILKGLGLGVFAILPFAPITIPIIVKLGKSVGVDILPSAFSNQNWKINPVEPLSPDQGEAVLATSPNEQQPTDSKNTIDQ